MIVLKQRDWTFAGVMYGLLAFKNTKHEDEYYLVRKAKLLDTDSNDSTTYDFDRMTEADKERMVLGSK